MKPFLASCSCAVLPSRLAKRPALVSPVPDSVVAGADAPCSSCEVKFVAPVPGCLTIPKLLQARQGPPLVTSNRNVVKTTVAERTLTSYAAARSRKWYVPHRPSPIGQCKTRQRRVHVSQANFDTQMSKQGIMSVGYSAYLAVDFQLLDTSHIDDVRRPDNTYRSF